MFFIRIYLYIYIKFLTIYNFFLRGKLNALKDENKRLKKELGINENNPK